MTAVAAPAPQVTRPRPVPWTRIVWVTWRQHRVALIGVAALLGGLALYLLIMGLKIHNGYASVMSCHPIHSAACLTLSDTFNRGYYPLRRSSPYSCWRSRCSSGCSWGRRCWPGSWRPGRSGSPGPRGAGGSAG